MEEWRGKTGARRKGQGWNEAVSEVHGGRVWVGGQVGYSVRYDDKKNINKNIKKEKKKKDDFFFQAEDGIRDKGM